MLVAVVSDIGLTSVLIVEEVGAVVARTRKTGTSENNQKIRNVIFFIWKKYTWIDRCHSIDHWTMC